MLAPTAAALAVLMASCGGESPPSSVTDAGPPPDTDAGPPPTGPHVELGVGGGSLADLPMSGGAVELVMGPQGGWHVDLGFRIWNLDPERLEVRYLVTGPDGAVLSDTSYLFGPVRFRQDGESFVHVTDSVVFDISGAEEVVGEEVQAELSVTDSSGNEASDGCSIRILDEM